MEFRLWKGHVVNLFSSKLLNKASGGRSSRIDLYKQKVGTVQSRPFYYFFFDFFFITFLAATFFFGAIFFIAFLATAFFAGAFAATATGFGSGTFLSIQWMMASP